MQTLGAIRLPDGRVQFRVWGYNAETIEVHLLTSDTYHPMERDTRGYYTCTLDDVAVGDTYLYRIDSEKERPDPASRHQPDGVHGASAVIDMDYDWTDHGFNPPTLRNTIFYELHVGTFTPEGTFEAIIPYLDYLSDLGITSIELLPIAEFPGNRNWGYDGVQLFAAHHTYGGVDGLRALVNAAHAKNIAVYLDVVYNHLGPEGNYLWDYAPYFTSKYRGAWGDNLNFDDDFSGEVRQFFIQNALYWLEICHIDGFRLDATHALVDFSVIPILEELTTAIHEWGDRHSKRVHVIAENDRSERKNILSRDLNGTGLDALWLDDLHHTIHTQLTGELDGYYGGFGKFADMVKCLREGFVRSGGWSSSQQKYAGTYSGDLPTDRFVVASQNHDQVGNRMQGERLEHLTSWESAKLAAGFAMLSPYVPLLFMGEEYAETNPFLYFTSHSDPALIEGVRQGRLDEFAYFADQGTPPDPQAESTFERSKLNHQLREGGKHKRMFQFYKNLIALRQTQPALSSPHRRDTDVVVDYSQMVIWLLRRYQDNIVLIAFNWHHTQSARTQLPLDETNFSLIFDSLDIQYAERIIMKPKSLDVISGGIVEIAPLSFVIYSTDE
ncbi:MAG: malto-oligosyltrehalose trehalohydrolase [Phototrophicaceae bacterium]